ncbi:MAG: HlyD family type I secretion periplasmic adaptor subunit [Rhodospirillales bacterium]|nr:HlyD family type I secretion periplasmic adaptor subunit [Rhodospirillales bacterium]
MTDTTPDMQTDAAPTPPTDKDYLAKIDPEKALQFAPDHVIFREGEDSDFAYLVIEGSVELTKGVEGTEIFLAEIGPGDLFGEMGLIDGSKRSATALTLEETLVQRIDRDALLDKLNQDSDFAAPVLSQLVSQLRETSSRLAHEQVLSLQRAADAADIIVEPNPGIMERFRGFFDADQDMIEFQPDAVEIERQKTPAIAKLMLYTILAFVIGVGVWANYSTVDTAVSAIGRITTEVPNIIVQPSETALVRSILVKEGQFVEKGQLLATLDATVARSDVVASRGSLTSMLAQEKRLVAELAGKLPPEGFSDDAAENALQTEVFARRQAGIREQLTSFDEQIKQIKAEVSSNIQDAKDLGEQAKVLREIEGMRSKLMKEGHGSRVNYLSAKHQRLSVDREQRQLYSTRTRMSHQLKALQADRLGALANWRSQVAEELVQTRREREQLTANLSRTEHRESLVRLTAPAPGIILKVAERSVGSVIQTAEAMFTIVPADVPMEMEADVQPKDIGLIQVGDFVRIKLDALPFQKHGIIEGRVRLISEDAVDTEANAAQTVYRSRIELISKNLREVPDSFRLTPGLTGSADITVGKRRIITYFIYPLIRAFDSSFHEP